MELKKIYKVMSISMLLIVVAQVSYPLLSEATVHATEITSQAFDAAMSSSDSFKDTKEGITEYDASNENVEGTDNLGNVESDTESNEVSPSDVGNELTLNEVTSDETTSEETEVTTSEEAEVTTSEEAEATTSEEAEATTSEETNLENEISNILTSEDIDRINNMDPNNLSEEDIVFLDSVSSRIQNNGIVKQYILNSLKYQAFNGNGNNDPWTPGDPLPGNNENEDFDIEWIASGNQYYQGQVDSYSKGAYYVYLDPTEPVTFEDVIGNTAVDLGPYGVDAPELCPYYKKASSNVPSNLRRTECDYVDRWEENTAPGSTIDAFLNGSTVLDVYLMTIFFGGNSFKIQADITGSGTPGYEIYLDEQYNFTDMSGNLSSPTITNASNTFFDQLGSYTFNYYPQFSTISTIDLEACLVSNPLLCTSIGGYNSSDVNDFFANSNNELTVKVVDDQQLLAANDIVVPEAFAPRSDAQVLSMSNAHFIEPEDFIDKYGENHAGDVYSVDDVNYVIDTGDYDYNNPTLGTHMVEITAISPTTGFEVSRVITIEVTNYYEGENESGILLANTPVVIDNNEGSYEALMKAEPITIIYKNGVLDHVEDETADENFFNLSIVQADLKGSSSEGRSFYRIGTNHDGIFYEDVIEVQQTWNGEPITDTITIDAIDNLTIQDNYKFDPLVTTNAHAYNSDGDKEDISVRTSGAYASTETNGQKVHQVVLEASNDEAYGVKLVNMDVVDVEDGEMPLIAARDANVRSSFTPDNAQDILDLMNVKAVDVDGTDITDLVQVFDTDGFEYGDGKLTGTPYQITLGVTSPLTGITVTTSKDLSVIGNSEVVPSVELAGNNPIYVKLGDGTTAEDITAMIAPDVLVYENKEFADAIDDSISLLNDDAYDNDTVGSYYFLYDGIYNEEKSDIDPISAENIYEVKVTDQIDKTQVPLSIDAPEDTKLVVGDDFNALEGVTATSTTDGDVTASIEVLQNEVDTTEAGDYDVTYHVSDSTGQESYKNVTVSVYDSEEDLNDAKEKEEKEKETKANNSNSSSDSESANASSEELTDTATTSVFRLVFTMVLALGAAAIVVRIKYGK